ncbi:hypothetical protein Val02_47840 [Virgisporangium aliadipatigenens]|uniref:CAAX prenyl protease 2/Lysostaphin resistance protein A-like domain-containing protein n=1 Tax=Virgisporangium aliadipatigenens TaxID=741659 RepID=A0A8J3YPH1_9ACTN|nr:CPBP family intramembrane glutamic endopeptidase [Virgisporangium aliadipatigenens]GIJ47898.1 hypothetical protein Val02_47840 [Virgisporangium aliadipatigenens]
MNDGPGDRAAPTRPPRPAVTTTVGLLAVVAVAGRTGPPGTALLLGPIASVGALCIGRVAGLDADDLGLGRRTWRTGAAWGVGCAAAVAACYAAAAAIPAVRPAFHDARYGLDPGAAARTAFLVVPLGTVLFEEVAFRGVLWGLVHAAKGPGWATSVSSVLFGLWHVLPSLRLNRVNPAVAGLVGTGRAGQATAVAGAVAFTAVAGVVLCELRRRSGSLWAPFGAHWGTNGLGVLVTAGLSR